MLHFSRTKKLLHWKYFLMVLLLHIKYFYARKSSTSNLSLSARSLIIWRIDCITLKRSGSILQVQISFVKARSHLNATRNFSPLFWKPVTERNWVENFPCSFNGATREKILCSISFDRESFVMCLIEKQHKCQVTITILSQSCFYPLFLFQNVSNAIRNVFLSTGVREKMKRKFLIMKQSKVFSVMTLRSARANLHIRCWRCR